MWTEFAACRGVDPELFFPVSEIGAGARQADRAKAVCDRCPVRRQCLAYAVATDAVGVWGGTTETERRGLRREAVSTGAASGDQPRASRPYTTSPPRRARMSRLSLLRHPEVVQFARNALKDPRGVLRASTTVLRTETGFRLLRLAAWVAPCSHEGVALDPTMRNHPTARIAILCHEALPGAMLAEAFGQEMSKVVRDLVDLHALFGQPSAPDPFAEKEV